MVSSHTRGTSESSHRFIEPLFILFNVFTKGGVHMLGRVGDDIDLSPEFIF